MADKKQRFAIISRFEKNAREKGVTLQPINKYSQQWAADAMIESYGYEDCLDIVDYYFIVSASPDWSWLAYNSEKLVQSRQAEVEDKALRARLRQGAKKWLEN